ncbi:hypothetical protein BSUBE1_3893 [Bacillus subtilis E1]|nr:hypothetical protein BSUBE1_3893 [Bacillus subtilis E1]
MISKEANGFKTGFFTRTTSPSEKNHVTIYMFTLTPLQLTVKQ